MEMEKAIRGRRIGLDIRLKTELTGLDGKKKVVDYQPEATDIITAYISGKHSSRDTDAVVEDSTLHLTWTPLWCGTYTLQVRIITFEGLRMWGTLPTFCNVANYEDLDCSKGPDRLLKLTMILRR